MSTYLGTLWRYNKKLFALACLFIIGALVPSIIRFEVTPFFDWKMYAWPVIPHRQYDAYAVYYNGKLYNKPHTWQDHRRMMISYTLPRYAMMKATCDTLPFYTKTSYVFLAAFRWNKRDNRLNTTPGDLNAYPVWLRRYLQQQTGEKIYSLQVQKVRLRFDSSYHVVPTEKEIVVNE